MVHVDHQREIDGVCRQVRILNCPQHTLDVVDAGVFQVALQQVEHLLLDVDAVDCALGADHARDASCEIACAHPNVGHLVAGFELERLDQGLWSFLRLARGALQPTGTEMSHHVGDLAAHVKLANAIAAVAGTISVARIVRIDAHAGSLRCRCLTKRGRTLAKCNQRGHEANDQKLTVHAAKLPLAKRDDKRRRLA